MDRSSPTGRGEASLRHGERPGKGGKGNGAGHMQGLAFFEGYGPWGGGRIAGDREDFFLGAISKAEAWHRPITPVFRLFQSC
jgi:hypothetical protein